MTARRLSLIAACCVLIAPSLVRAQADWLPGLLDNGQAPNGIPGTVESFAMFDPDGAGPLPEELVAAGNFTAAEGVPANNIAARDPITGTWHALGSGTDEQIRAIVVYNGELYAGGLFTNAGGAPGTRYIAKWNGTSWQGVGGAGNYVYALTVFNGELIAGGYFLSAGPVAADHIAAYNGSTWRALGSSINGNDWVVALGQFNGDLIAGGFFTSMNGIGANHIARWNGSWWSPLGAGLDAEVLGLGLYNGALIAGGRFTHSGAIVTNGIARWNGSSWSTFGTGLSSSALAFATYNGELIAGGAFLEAGGGTARSIARWNGSTWSTMGQGTNGGVDALMLFNGEVLVGGNFSTAGFSAASSIARWNGYDWAPFGAGNALGVFAITTYLGRLVVGGGFHEAVVSGNAAHNIAAWDGLSLKSYGLGTDNPVLALKAFKYSGPIGSYELIAGGTFTHAGGVAANRIARWNESPIFGSPPPNWQAMGGGFNSGVNAIERFNALTYAGGLFTSPQSRIARWNETSDTWEAMSTGMNGTVNALKTYGGYLYAGGSFTTAGGVSTGGLARWDGTSWSVVGGFFTGTVLALEVHNNLLVIGGSFPGISGSPNLAQYNGSFYSTVGTGGANQTVRSLTSLNGRLYVGGDFSTMGGVAAPFAAFWDGSWHALPNGVDQKVLAMSSYQGEVQAGGYMNAIHGGTLASPRWARYSPAGVPWIALNPYSQSVPPGGDIVLRSEAADGYTGLIWQWYKDGVALNDGPTGTSSLIGGAHTKSLTVTNVSQPDHGIYMAMVHNGAGTDTSFAVTVSVTGSTAVDPGLAHANVFEAIGPNPTAGPTQLTFALARQAPVRMRVQDVSGRTVRILELGAMAPGRHQATWDLHDVDGRSVRPGMYFVGLEVGGSSLGYRRVAILR